MTYLKLLLFSVILVAILFIGLGIKLLFDKKAKIAGGCGGGNKSDGMGCACGSHGSCQSETSSSTSH